MEQSLELPHSDDENNPQHLEPPSKSKQSSNPNSLYGSPAEPSSVSKFRISRYNQSQQSLQYSVSTYKEDTHRSPKFINLPLLEIDKPKIVVEEDRGKIKEIVNISTHSTKNKKLRIESPQTYNPANLADIDERKTLESRNMDYMKVMKRNRQLEHALQLQTMVSEELRSKLSIMVETLEKNIRDAGYGEFLKLRNTSKTSNIDLFLQVQKIRKEQQSKQRDTSKLRQENEGLVKHLSIRTNELEKANRAIKSLESQVKVLQDRISMQNKTMVTRESEQKQSLINYIEELKKEYKSVTSKYEEGNTKIKLLHKEVEQLKEAQLHVTRQSSSKKHNEQQIERLSDIIDSKNTLIEKLNEEAETIRLQYENDVLKRDEIIQAMEERLLKFEPTEQHSLYPDSLEAITKVDVGIGSERTPPQSSIKKNLTTPNRRTPDQNITQSSQKKHVTVNKTEKRMMDRLRWQLDSYKQQCEYYHQEYLKKMADSAELHSLKLQYKTDIQYLKDKIRELTQSSSHKKFNYERILAV